MSDPTGAPAGGPDLRPDCGSCAGLCCVLLPFARSTDFPESKAAGDPCHHLLPDDRCSIHDRLRPQGWVGCTVFECFGAGQRVTNELFERSWRDDDGTRAAMGEVFPLVHRLHEMLWYLADPAVAATRHADRAKELAGAVDAVVRCGPGAILREDLTALRTRVGLVLRAVSDDVRGRAQAAGAASPRLPRRARPGADLAGASLRRADLRSAPLRGALLIAADLRGADLRGADLRGAAGRDADARGADLRGVIFLTQPQVNALVGDSATRLPARLRSPGHWT